MELDRLWSWNKKKLACRIRPENGNPIGDNLRETFAELAGVDLNELLSEMKNTKKKREQTNKVSTDFDAEKNFKEVLGRSRILGAAKQALDRMEEYDSAKSTTLTQKNVKKLYTVLPKSPPKRVMLDIVRERSKPLRLPDQEEHKSATDKLEKKLAKQRAARMAAIEQSAKDDSANRQSTAATDISTMGLTSTQVFGTYEGDLFSTGGEYLDGMLYLSRMADSSVRTKRLNFALIENEKKNSEEEKKAVEVDKANERDITNKKESEDSSIGEISTNPDINAKFSCAVALCNWARNPANAYRLASEGGVRAIVQLTKEPVVKILVYCAVAFRFMSESSVLAGAIIEENGIAAISDMISSNSDEFILYNLAIALVNLTRINGKEGQLVDAAIVLALMNLIMLKPELGIVCVRGLYNLTCVDVSYPSIERVIRALVTLSLSGTSNVKHLCAAALCNLSDLKSVRPRMVEEGAINVLTALSRGAETRTRRICAVILQNLSAAKSVRVEMASRNSVQVAYGLSSDQDPIILRCIGLTLSRLAMESTNCQRIVHEGGIAALCNIAVKYPTIPGITQPVASAFQLLSSNKGFRVQIVSEGSVTAIASLLRSSVDMFTLQHSLLALCNLLCHYDNHLPIIQQGLILTLIAMCNNENDLLRDFCSLAFLNLSATEDSRKHLINAGAVGAIISIAKQNTDVTKKRCAATFCNLSYYGAGMGRMVSDGIIPALVDLVQAKDITTVHYACAALCRLCSTVENARLILDSGAVPRLVQGTIEGDQTTKQFCGSVLSSLSFYEYCRIPLCDYGAIAALKGLATLNDITTKQRCLVAFANLSCEASVQQKMIQEGVVKIIAELANSYQEINYICCAKAICNLACCDGYKMAVASEGGVVALLLISMVQSVERITKLLCVLGLNNLLDESTMEYMLGEGIVGTVANLSKLGDAHISNLCVKIFNHLSRYPFARQKIVERTTTIKALFQLATSPTLETQIIAVRTVCNLIFDDQVCGHVVKADVFRTLEKGLMLDDSSAVTQCLQASFSLCSDDIFIEAMAKSDLPGTLATLAVSPMLQKEELDLISKIIVMMAHSKKGRVSMQNVEFMGKIIKVLQRPKLTEQLSWILTALGFLVSDYREIPSLLTSLDILPTLHSLHKQLQKSDEFSAQAKNESYRALVEIMHTISEYEECIQHLANGNTMELLQSAVDSLDESDTASRTYCFPRDWVLYHLAVLIYRFAGNESPIIKQATATQNTCTLLKALSLHSKCADLVAISLGLYLTDQKCRSPFLVQDTGFALSRIYEYSLSEATLSNLVLGFYYMSKLSVCREFMLNPELNIERILAKLVTHENAKIKANANRASKNLNSDLFEAVEEGAIATLIAMSLEGKIKNQASDEFSYPSILPVTEMKFNAPSCKHEAMNNDEVKSSSSWFARVVVTKGGAAGKGPEPPEPPAMSTEGSAQYPNMMEELDGGEVEGKTKMAFAKMQIPHNLKESYLLSDGDFLLNDTRDELTATETESSMEMRSELLGESSILDENTAVNAGNVATPVPQLVRNGSSRMSRNGGLRSLSRAGTARTIEEITYNNNGSAANDSALNDDKRSVNSDYSRVSANSPDQISKQPRKTKKLKKSGSINDPNRLTANNLSEQAAKMGLFS